MSTAIVWVSDPIVAPVAARLKPSARSDVITPPTATVISTPTAGRRKGTAVGGRRSATIAPAAPR